ncbi:hypothetical protein TCAL_15195 [Tigriopus californicus]|uniref:SET domain-containing protein n=1 Tax=Tigriopus californicus TaxID=6832 RepID=A0A553NED2_TIGCA|nr:histone-lysine N-methyltransferase SETD7-like [Tigriopus californicus]TRY63804.1 hypothetical protein TCAL_15195 [Tigriopus californicus]
METSAVASTLRDWFMKVGDPLVDPFPNRKEDEEHLLDNHSSSINPWHGFFDNVSPSSGHCSNKNVTYKGQLNDKGLRQGSGRLFHENGDELNGWFDNGKPSGDVVITSPRRDISRLIGTYRDGCLNGRATMVNGATTVFECFVKDDVPHGPVRQIHMKKFREFRRQITFIGHHRHGIPHGVCWEYREGGGFLTGVPNAEGKFTGEQITYVYPDFETCWHGRFQDGKMEEGYPGKIIDYRFERDIMVVQLNVDRRGKPTRYCLSTKSSMGEDLLVPDPYETKWILCENSLVSGAGDGVFARRDIPKNTIVAFYNGVRLPFVLGGPKEDWSTSGYKIFVNADFKSGERMNIPLEYVSLENYCATLGHKVNHSFEPNCTEWFIDHPRFGVIPCERTSKDIKTGDELFLDYEYDPYNCPEWFEGALRSFVGDSSEEQLDHLNDRYKRFVSHEIVDEVR